MRKLNVPSKGFRCGKISRLLGKDATEILGPKDGAVTTMTVRKKRCLVCGSCTEMTNSSVLSCKMGCDFTAHSRCLKIMRNVTEKKDNNLVVEEELGDFVCNDIVYQFMPSEIDAYVDSGESAGALDRLVQTVKLRGRVNTLRYRKALKRYLNEEFVCKLCGESVSIDQDEHEMRNCSGVIGTPITDKNCMYPLSRIKRLRLWMYPDHPT